MGYKRGPKTGPVEYHPRTYTMKLEPEYRDLIARRTMPFLDHYGASIMPLSEILRDCYLQGVKDALQVMEPE